MIDRRQFLRVAGGTAATLAAADLAGCARAATGTSAAAQPAATPGATPTTGGSGAIHFPITDVGVQLYTVRTAMQQNLDDALRQVAGAGYRLVEIAGTANKSPAEFRALLDRYGLQAISGHWGLPQVEDVDTMIATAKTLGHRYVVVPSLPASVHGSLDAWRALADRFNRLGERYQAAGLTLGYHNHNHEWETFGGQKPGYDAFVERLDPALVTLEADLYWMHVAGQEPLDYFERFPGRFQLWHVKDAKATGQPGDRMTEVGNGVIDWPALFAAADHAGLKYAFVEHDRPTDAIASIQTSHQYLEKLLSRG